MSISVRLTLWMLVGLPLVARAGDGSPPDLIVRNARVVTLDALAAFAEPQP